MADNREIIRLSLRDLKRLLPHTCVGNQNEDSRFVLNNPDNWRQIKNLQQTLHHERNNMNIKILDKDVWELIRPVNVLKINSIADDDNNLLTDLCKEKQNICEVLNIKHIPCVYMIGDCPLGTDKPEGLYKNHTIYIPFNRKTMFFILAHELFHAYQHENRLTGDIIEHEIEAVSFAYAYCCLGEMEKKMEIPVIEHLCRHQIFPKEFLDDHGENDRIPRIIKEKAVEYYNKYLNAA